MRSFFQLACLIACLLVCSIANNAVAHPPQDATDDEVTLVGVASMAGDSLDLSGLTQVLVPEEGTTEDAIAPGTQFTNNMLGGISAIAWSGKEDLYWCLPDRGPLDGAVDWSCRIHQVRISMGLVGDQQASQTSGVTAEIVKTILLKDKRGIPFTGLASAFAATETTTRRLDPEGVRVGIDGNLFISDEYGPCLLYTSPSPRDRG